MSNHSVNRRSVKVVITNNPPMGVLTIGGMFHQKEILQGWLVITSLARAAQQIDAAADTTPVCRGAEKQIMTLSTLGGGRLGNLHLDVSAAR